MDFTEKHDLKILEILQFVTTASIVPVRQNQQNRDDMARRPFLTTMMWHALNHGNSQIATT